MEKVAAALKHTKDEDIEGTMNRALKFFDHDGGDMVTVSELSHVGAVLCLAALWPLCERGENTAPCPCPPMYRQVLAHLGEKLPKADIDEIFRQAEVRGEGRGARPWFQSSTIPVVGCRWMALARSTSRTLPS